MCDKHITIVSLDKSERIIKGDDTDGSGAPNLITKREVSPIVM